MKFIEIQYGFMSYKAPGFVQAYERFSGIGTLTLLSDGLGRHIIPYTCKYVKVLKWPEIL